MMDKYKIYLDFDGTVVEHMYPMIGDPVPNAISVINKLINAGHNVILNTYRANLNIHSLSKAVDYLNKVGIKIKYLQRKLEPNRWDWELQCDSKVIFIDDITPGIPMTKSKNKTNIVNWYDVEKELIKNKLI